MVRKHEKASPSVTYTLYPPSLPAELPAFNSSREPSSSALPDMDLTLTEKSPPQTAMLHLPRRDHLKIIQAGNDRAVI